jgi:uncharacterized membrane protein (DUF2068 family)
MVYILIIALLHFLPYGLPSTVSLITAVMIAFKKQQTVEAWNLPKRLW